MSRPSLATPCPPPQPRRPSGLPRLSVVSSSFGDLTAGTFDDTTTNIDFTRAIQHEFRAAKPRRRTSLTAAARRAEKNAPVAIFEDVPEDAELTINLEPAPKKLEGKTLLGKAARRMPGTVAAARKSTIAEEPEVKVHALRDVGQARRRASIMPSEAEAQPEKNDFARNLRRRTIFVPTDATTLMTIHPGAANGETKRLDDTFLFSAPQMPAVVQEEPDEEDALDALPQLQKPIRRPRKSLAAAPRRVPLQHLSSQEETVSFEVCGANTGKENVPPQAEYVAKKTSGVQPLGVKSQGLNASSRLLESTAASQNRQSIMARKAVPLPKQVIPQKRLSVSRPTASSTATMTSSNRSMAAAPRTSILNKPKERTPPKPPVVSRLEQQQQLRKLIAANRASLQTSKLSQYPLLPEDLSHPELYEDGWLSHQEIALTEVVNEILSTTAQDAHTWDQPTKSLRERMIETYHQPEVTMLHKRVQASLVYGALNRPKELANSCNPSLDLGLRKRYLCLWLDNYNEDVLRTAAEVVVGRQIPRRSAASRGSAKASESVIDPHASRRSLTAFLETFFVSASDVDPSTDAFRNDDGSDLETARWRKTMLRSLMLIWLLDHAKVAGDVPQCLFQKSASKKSSAAVLRALSSLLLPAIGDITRALRHMDYDVGHVQDPLDEVEYKIENLAVDLRDGVLLARLVEVLLYSDPQKFSRYDGNETVTLRLPDATILESALYAADRVTPAPRILSQHLKMPCIGRAQKVFNVQVSLAALERHDVHAANAVADVSAADLVDGHREKTLALLWALVSSFGLARLVDWKELEADVRRVGDVNAGDLKNASGKVISREQQEELLLAWAAAYCDAAAKKRDTDSVVRVSNLTTSFADGRAYAIIVDAFAGFITPAASSSFDTPLSATANPSALLASRLRALGCSSTFTTQLTTSTSLPLVPRRETTISHLAFLASRLLPLARRHHAAVAVQRAWQCRAEKLMMRKRIAAMRLAHACAVVVQTRERIVHAAITVQRAWRGVLEARIGRLNRDVVTVQVLIRGWAVRRAVRLAMGAGGVGEGRVMGGW